MGKLVIYDLCGGTGAWSAPYKAAGYDVHLVDLPHDVRLIQDPGIPVHGVLCAPPCTVFARSGARWSRSEADMREAMSVVDACLRFVLTVKPSWWALENPVGTLRRYIGQPRMYFNPCDYGDPYTKKTCLWGDFAPLFKKVVRPTEGSKMSRLYGGKSERTKRMRSVTPPGFAQAFFEANP